MSSDIGNESNSDLDAFLADVLRKSSGPLDNPQAVIGAAEAIATGRTQSEKPRVVEVPLYLTKPERDREKQESTEKAWEREAILKELVPEYMRLMNLVNETLIYRPSKQDDLPITVTPPPIADSVSRERHIVFDAPGNLSIATRVRYVGFPDYFIDPSKIQPGSNALPKEVLEGRTPYLPREERYTVDVGAIDWKTGQGFSVTMGKGMLRARKTKPELLDRLREPNRALWEKGAVGFDIDRRPGSAEEMVPSDFDRIVHGLEQRKINPHLTNKITERTGGQVVPTAGPFGAHITFAPGVGIRI